MAKEIKKDPIEGFQITDYNEKDQSLTIELHPYLFKTERQRNAVFKKFREIIEHGPGISKVTATPRKKRA